MIDDEDIRAAAEVLILQHGDMATVAAAQRIGELEVSGDLEGASVWRRIQRAVIELAKTEPDGPVN